MNYYRLSGYLYPFRILPGDNFVAGTDLDTVWRRYTFDRRLRLLVLDAMERIEVAVRARLNQPCRTWRRSCTASIPAAQLAFSWLTE